MQNIEKTGNGKSPCSFVQSSQLVKKVELSNALCEHMRAQHFPLRAQALGKSLRPCIGASNEHLQKQYLK